MTLQSIMSEPIFWDLSDDEHENVERQGSDASTAKIASDMEWSQNPFGDNASPDSTEFHDVKFIHDNSSAEAGDVGDVGKLVCFAFVMIKTT